MHPHHAALRVLLVGTVLSACTVGPDYAPQASQVADGWASETQLTSAEGQPLTAWWQSFNDPLLTRIIDETAQHNLDVRIAAVNIERARALRRSSIAPLFPALGVGASVERTGLSGATSRNRSNAEQDRDTYDAGLDASWELDVFGYTRRSVEAADAYLEASEENRRDVLSIALAEVAQSYFTARGLQKRIVVLRHNIELLEGIESLAKTQFELGVVTEFDYARAMGERQQVQATLPALEADLAAAISRISVLAGKEPSYYSEALQASAALPAPPDLVPVGLRSDMLRRRPDIRRAEREAAAASAQIGVATADLFPRFFLTGSAGQSALRFSDLFSSSAFTYTLGTAMNWSLFSGGSRLAQVDVAEADSKAALLTYEQAVLRALEEAEVSLVRYAKEWQALQQLRASEAQRREAFNIAQLRYEAGEENFLVILDAERSLVTVQDLVVQSEARILSYLTQLYKALGGGWQAFEPAAAAAEPTPKS